MSRNYVERFWRHEADRLIGEARQLAKANAALSATIKNLREALNQSNSDRNRYKEMYKREAQLLLELSAWCVENRPPRRSAVIECPLKTLAGSDSCAGMWNIIARRML